MKQQLPHDSAFTHVSGESVYISDELPLLNEVLVDVFASPMACGDIVSLDISVALKISGVVGIYTYKNIPGHNRLHSKDMDQPILAEMSVNYIGEPIAIIAATSSDALYQARQAIKVEIQPKQPIFSIDEAVRAGSFISDEVTIVRGDLDVGFNEASHVIEATFISGGQEHFYLESQSARVVPGEQNQFVVHASSQHPTEVQHCVAAALGLSYHKVVCVVKRMGGGFGGKESQAAPFAVLASIVAYHTRRPARIHLRTEDDMRWTGKRHPFQTDYRVGFNDQGLIEALDLKLLSNGGAYADLSIPILERALFHADNSYFIPNMRVSGRVCRTNLAPNTAFRGFGGPQGMIVIENIIEEIALFLKRDALEIRRKNLYGKKSRNITHYGQIVTNNVLPELIEQLVKTSNYSERLAQIGQQNDHDGVFVRGISLIPIKFGISFTARFLNQANALVNLHLDGSVQVSTGATEMGQGVNTKIRQLVADEFGIEPLLVTVMPTSTEKNHNTSPTAASSGADLNGAAAIRACRKIKKRLAAIALVMSEKSDEANVAECDVQKIRFQKDDKFIFQDSHVHVVKYKKSIPLQQLIKIAYGLRISLGGYAFYRIPKINFDAKLGRGRPFLYFTQGACCAEVKIDRFTGITEICRADLLMDVGKPLHRNIDLGQIKGAFMQGVGWVTMEELRYAANGELLSFSPATYKVPTISDLPQIFNVELFDNPNSTESIKRSKAVGEPPFMLALAVWTAIKHAVAFTSEEIPRFNLPATIEEILLTIEKARM